MMRLSASLSGILAVALLACVRVAVAEAPADASGWANGSHSAIRLLSGGASRGQVQLAGVEMRLLPGYKTYWRTPGDSGVPPVFDWSRSQNLGSITVLWPAPERFSDGAGSSIGYHGEVVFPVHVTAADPKKPVKLALKLDYAVCDQMCIPARGEAELKLGQPNTAQTQRLEAFEARVPLNAVLGEAADRLAVSDIKPVRVDKEQVLRFDVAVPPGGFVSDAFVEGPDMWMFGAARMSLANPQVMTIEVLITDRPKNHQGATPLIVTLAGSPRAVEIRIDLDIPAMTP
jgi:DsbC/DsbD-like thiol-disulfide interchange protein